MSSPPAATASGRPTSRCCRSAGWRGSSACRKSRGQEFVIAIAGPLVNVAIAAIIFVVLGYSVGLEQMRQIENPRADFFARLAGVNVFLVLFNLIPAFPMDGGRVLRARARDLAALVARHPDRRDHRPGACLRLRLHRPVLQPAADLHRDLRLSGGRRRGANRAASRGRVERARRRRDGHELLHASNARPTSTRRSRCCLRPRSTSSRWSMPTAASRGCSPATT